MSDEYQELPEKLQQILPQEIWDSWSAEQRAYILAHEGQLVESFSSEKQGLSQLYSEYQDKKWEVGQSRPPLQEYCQGCKFDYCFYAQPRNWSMSSESDVWNLMKCANVKCQSYFESCL
ncbi:hypothetical protein [Pantanalinema sp. GBBB05]|uniref:hypothetical protein n=1 Tax=Pantanalinema sp. GBBB05 TaxID=2604139 RepID=UPI001D63815F|nr:hypothetical protein [Pantanalinema sp. GBBB05]